MILLSWRDEYRVGVEQIDTEHRFLFALINEFHDSYQGGRSKRDLLQVLQRLVAYAEQHFQNEEALMAASEYPRLEGHHGLHEKLVASIFELNESLSTHEGSVNAATLRFLKNWLLDHIIVEDMAFGDFLKRRKATSDSDVESSPD